jgi:hypothetical protein
MAHSNKTLKQRYQKNASVATVPSRLPQRLFPIVLVPDFSHSTVPALPSSRWPATVPLARSIVKVSRRRGETQMTMPTEMMSETCAICHQQVRVCDRFLQSK